MDWIIGITASLIAGFLFYFIENIIVPFITGIIEHTVNLSGRYLSETKNPSGYKQSYELTIRQIGNRVNAILEVETTDIKASSARFRLSGNIKDRLVLLQGRVINSRYIAANSYLLEVKKGGTSLTGKKLWFSKTHDIIESIDIEFKRKKD
jgi:hypothetical protein